MFRSAPVVRLRQSLTQDGARLRARLGLGLALLLPIALLMGRAYGEAMATALAVFFLIDRAMLRDWDWLRAPWTAAAFALWLWVLLCTLVTGTAPAIVQAVVLVRFFLLLAALDTWALDAGARAERRGRVWLQWVVLGCALWLLGEVWHQYLSGANLSGVPRAGDGALTGPFTRPRAGPVYLELFFPAFLPVLLYLTGRPGWGRWLTALLILAVTTATMVLIGQRMPAMLLLLGLCATGLLFRRFRLPVLVALLAAGVLLALTPIISPPTFAKLVVKFSDQMEHFFATPYGMLFGRAVTMIQAHPWLGLGWDGFKDHCMDPAYLTGVSWLPVSNPASPDGCSVHPHNYWTQIATTCGLPGLALFGLLVGLWLWRMAGGTAFRRNGRRGALLVFLIVSMWPIASATSLFTFPNAGWTFLMIGWGLAEARGDDRLEA